MENVVYLLGAGFSAPLGLPLVSNFRFKSQDMYRTNLKRYSHFDAVFRVIDEMSSIKNYYAADLHNIEEVLSLLEMRSYLEGNGLKNEFIQYLKDVIEYYTPSMPSYPGGLPANWQDFIFGHPDDGWTGYGAFVACILGLEVENKAMRGDAKLAVTQLPHRNRYTVLTLNYDMVLETIPEFCKSNYQAPKDLGFADHASSAPVGFTRLLKLHGSVGAGDIIPPTWSKGTNTKIAPIWKAAQQALREATQIRIIGYSLPQTDAYIKYLLKSAAIESRFLEKIDVIVLDGDGGVERRFRDFIPFRSFRFISGRTEDYLEVVRNNAFSRLNYQAHTMQFKDLEKPHDAFMNGNVK